MDRNKRMIILHSGSREKFITATKRANQFSLIFLFVSSTKLDSLHNTCAWRKLKSASTKKKKKK